METNKYKMGWLIVMFDLPTKTPAEKKGYHEFREFLLNDGFQMLQYSIYARPCVSFARQKTHTDRVQLNLPPSGHIFSFIITKRQWENAYRFYSKDSKTMPTPSDLEFPEQFTLW